MPPEEVIGQVKKWFQKAEHDFKAIELIMAADEDECPFDTVCFHAQQAAEKYLKGYLVFFEISPPKLHNLRELTVLLPEDVNFPEMIGELYELTRLSVAPRYPDDLYEIDQEVAESASNIAR